MESCFRAFGGAPEKVPLDYPRTHIQHHDPVSRETVVNPDLFVFARHWGFKVKPYAPFHARTKGKDERRLRYMKKNPVEGRRFESFAALRAYLCVWTRKVADARTYGTITGEAPHLRFDQDETHALQPSSEITSFLMKQTLVQKVTSDWSVRSTATPVPRLRS